MYTHDPVVKPGKPSKSDKERIERLKGYQAGIDLGLRERYDPFPAGKTRVDGENPMRSVVARVVKPQEPITTKQRRALEGYRNNGLPTSSKKSSLPSTPEAVAAPEAREQVKSVTQSSPRRRLTVTESARALLKRIADRPGKEADILRARVREGVENITPPPPPGKPVGGKSTHLG